MNHMDFYGGPLHGHRYLLIESTWVWAGSEEHSCIQVPDVGEVRMIPVTVREWRGVTVNGPIRMNYSNGDRFDIELPDGRKGRGYTPQEACDAAYKDSIKLS